jgi:hypothetical protein
MIVGLLCIVVQAEAVRNQLPISFVKGASLGVEEVSWEWDLWHTIKNMSVWIEAIKAYGPVVRSLCWPVMVIWWFFAQLGGAFAGVWSLMMAGLYACVDNSLRLAVRKLWRKVFLAAMCPWFFAFWPIYMLWKQRVFAGAIWYTIYVPLLFAAKVGKSVLFYTIRPVALIKRFVVKPFAFVFWHAMEFASKWWLEMLLVGVITVRVIQEHYKSKALKKKPNGITQEAWEKALGTNLFFKVLDYACTLFLIFGVAYRNADAAAKQYNVVKTVFGALFGSGIGTKWMMEKSEKVDQHDIQKALEGIDEIDAKGDEAVKLASTGRFKRMAFVSLTVLLAGGLAWVTWKMCGPVKKAVKFTVKDRNWPEKAEKSPLKLEWVEREDVSDYKKEGGEMKWKKRHEHIRDKHYSTTGDSTDWSRVNQDWEVHQYHPGQRGWVTNKFGSEDYYKVLSYQTDDQHDRFRSNVYTPPKSNVSFRFKSEVMGKVIRSADGWLHMTKSAGPKGERRDDYTHPFQTEAAQKATAKEEAFEKEIAQLKGMVSTLQQKLFGKTETATETEPVEAKAIEVSEKAPEVDSNKLAVVGNPKIELTPMELRMATTIAELAVRAEAEQKDMKDMYINIRKAIEDNMKEQKDAIEKMRQEVLFINDRIKAQKAAEKQVPVPEAENKEIKCKCGQPIWSKTGMCCTCIKTKIAASETPKKESSRPTTPKKKGPVINQPGTITTDTFYCADCKTPLRAWPQAWNKDLKKMMPWKGKEPLCESCKDKKHPSAARKSPKSPRNEAQKDKKNIVQRLEAATVACEKIAAAAATVKVAEVPKKTDEALLGKPLNMGRFFSHVTNVKTLCGEKEKNLMGLQSEYVVYTAKHARFEGEPIEHNKVTGKNTQHEVELKNVAESDTADIAIYRPPPTSAAMPKVPARAATPGENCYLLVRMDDGVVVHQSGVVVNADEHTCPTPDKGGWSGAPLIAEKDGMWIGIHTGAWNAPKKTNAYVGSLECIALFEKSKGSIQKN